MSARALNPRTLRRFAAGFAVALLSGCAVLRIDVDVYKGPLANHEEVQLRQYGALALAAKPVLIQLRNLYEKGLPTTLWSETHIDQNSKGTYQLQNPLALRLNEALSFYQPQGEPGIREYLNKARPQAEKIRAGSNVLGRNTTDRDLHTKLSEALQPALKKAAGAKEPGLCLGAAYLLFLDAEDARARKLVLECEETTKQAWLEAAGSTAPNPDPVRERYVSRIHRACVGARKIDSALQCAENETGNALFGMLESQGEVGRQLLLLPVTWPAGLERELRDHAINVGRTYREVRESQDAMFHETLKLLSSELASLKPGAGTQGDSAIRQAAGRILGDIVQLRNFACAYSIREKIMVSAPTTLAATFAGQPALANGYWGSASPDTYERFKPVFVSAVERHPAEMVWFLHALDKAFRDAPDAALDGCKGLVGEGELAAMRSQTARRFGLARGPSLDRQELERLQAALDRNFLALRPASGFEEGRFRSGLADLVQDYVKLVEDAPSLEKLDRERLRRTSQRLEEMLLIFAEKILYIANNQTLLERPVSGQERVATRAERDVSTQYVLTLQSIGNSIISFANDVRFRRDHVKRGQDREPAERRAAIVSQRTGAPLVLDTVLARLRSLATEAGRNVEQFPPATQAPGGTAPSTDVVTLRQRLVHAYRTVSGEAGDVPGLPRIDAAQRPQLAGSAQGIAAKLDKLADKVTGEDIRKAIEDWLNAEHEQIAAAARDSARAVRLKESREHFKSATADFAALIPAAADRKEAVKAAMAKLKRDYDETVALIRAAAAADGARTAQATVATNRSAAEGRKSELDAAVRLFEASRGGMLAALAASGETSGNAILDAILRKLRTDSTGKTGAELKPYETTLAAVEGLRGKIQLPDLRPEAAREGAPKGTARDVLDDVLATLRYARIQATTAGDAAGVENIDKAIKFAYEQRGGLAYLRPASAYLRNVYAGTALQSDPRTHWSNMLRQQSIRATPFLGEMIINEADDLRRVRSEVDRQFWQNINSVRVAGGGSTNYVLAKDDTGNWYVKGYEADPSSVIKSARGLMLFNLGRSMDANLLARSDIMQELGSKGLDATRRGELNDQLKKLDESDKTRGGGSGLSSALGRFRQSYRTRLQEDFTALKSELDSGALATELQNAWTARVPTYKAALDTVSKADAAELKDAAAALAEPQAKDDAKLAQAHVDGILNALRQVRRYHAAVLAHVAKSVQPASVATLQEQERLKQGALTGREEIMKLADSQYVTALENHRKAADDAARLITQPEVDKQKSIRDMAKSALDQAQTEYNTAKQNLGTAQAEAQKAAADRDTANKEANRIILGFISRHGNKRLAAAQQFEDSVTFLSAGAN